MKTKKQIKSDVKFWEIARANAKAVATWPKWKQQIRITAERANSGNFIAEVEE